MICSASNTRGVMSWTPPDIEKLMRVGADYGCQVLAPPVGTT